MPAFESTGQVHEAEGNEGDVSAGTGVRSIKRGSGPPGFILIGKVALPARLFQHKNENNGGNCRWIIFM